MAKVKYKCLQEKYDILKELKSFTELFAFLRILPPYKWETNKYSLNLSSKKSDILHWKIKCYLLGILAPLATILIFIYLHLSASNSTQVANVAGFLFMTIFLFAPLINICVLRYYKFAISELKGLYDLDNFRYGELMSKKTYDENRKTNSYEGNAKQIVLFFISLRIFILVLYIPIILMIFYVITYNFTPFYLYNTGSAFLNMTIACICTTYGWDGVIMLTTIVKVGFVHLYFTNKWIINYQLTWSARLNNSLKWKFHIFWRAIHIHHYFGKRVVGKIAPFVLPATELMSIIAIFSLIRLHVPFMFKTFLFSIAFFTNFVLWMTLIFINKLSNGTQNVKNLLKKDVSLKRNKMDNLRFKSYQRLKYTFGFGGTLPVHNQLFLIIMQDIIISSVVNLLVLIEK